MPEKFDEEPVNLESALVRISGIESLAVRCHSPDSGKRSWQGTGSTKPPLQCFKDRGANALSKAEKTQAGRRKKYG